MSLLQKRPQTGTKPKTLKTEWFWVVSVFLDRRLSVLTFHSTGFILVSGGLFLIYPAKSRKTGKPRD